MRARTTIYIASLLAACCMSSARVCAQQLPQYSQYMHNPFLVNPAAAGMEDYVDVTAGFRQQWAGYDNAPQSFYLSGHGYLGQPEPPEYPNYSVPISNPQLYRKKEHERSIRHGLGGIAARDDYGAFRRTSLSAAYAIHLPVGKHNFLSIGANIGWYGMDFDNDLIRLEEAGDNTYNDFITQGNHADLLDLNLGAMFYGNRFYVGYGVYQVFQNQLELGNEESPAGLTHSHLQIHHFLSGAYRFSLSRNVELEPSTLLKLMSPAPLSFDINIKGIYRDAFWLGVSYRYQNAVVAMLGAQINRTFRIGYSFDVTTSNVADYESGTHEIVLGVNLFAKKAGR